MRHGGGAKSTKAGRGEVSGGSKSKHGRSTSIKQRDSGGGKHDLTEAADTLNPKEAMAGRRGAEAAKRTSIK